MTVDARRMFQRRRTAAQWTSENPTLADGEFGVERDTGIVKVGNGSTAWNSLAAINNVAELIAADPTEIGLSTVGNDTTISLGEPVARTMEACVIGQYYLSHDGVSSAQTMTLDQIEFRKAMLPKGTMDRIGVDVTTAGGAGAIVRCGIYDDAGGTPGGRIAEASSTADATTTGIKDLTISAVIPINGPYWFAVVSQVSACSIQGGPSWTTWRSPLGTSAVGGTTAFVGKRQAGVSGALPSSASVAAAGSQGRIRCHFRYSA